MTAMARKKRGASNRGKTGARRVLADHHEHKKRLIPPLMRFPLSEISWHRDQLPDFLWLALMMGRRADWQAARSALDIMDRFVPKGPRFADGRLSTFALVPEGQRESARLALRAEAPHALPEAFGHALGLYPSCPARWLYEDWLKRHEPDPETGVALMRSLVEDNRDKSGIRETRLRMCAISRAVKHGKLQDPGILEFGAKYPGGLSTSEQRRFEAQMRAAWMSFAGMESVKYPPNEWPRKFWKRSRELTPCQFHVELEEEEMPEEEDGPLDAEPLMQLSEMQAIVKACDALGKELRQVQLKVFEDPAHDEPNAVLLGLASRMYRLLYAFIERPSAWTPDVGGLHLRPIVDTRILVGWLIARDDPEIYAAYREHGLGRLKLLREHIKADFGEDLDDKAQEVLDYLDGRVNLERDELFQPVNLGSFTDVDIRKMAIEAGLKREYDLTYAPLSSENHGEWPTVREDDTLICEEPLHGNHRVGAFRPPLRTTSSASVFAALDLARAGVGDIFGYYGKDIRPAFDRVKNALERAAYAPGESKPEGHGSTTK
jgi:hypothetical protein